MNRSTGRLTTSRLTHLVRGARTHEQATSWHRNNGPVQLKDALYELCQARNVSNRQVIERCGLERSYYYHILSGQKIPSRNMLLRLALCIGCTPEEANRLLCLARLTPLYVRVRRDALLIWALQHGKTMAEVNELLLTEGEDPLYREDQRG